MAKQASPRGGAGRGQGRKQKAIVDRTPVAGKVAIRISVAAATELQQLMLQPVDSVRTPGDMVEHLIHERFIATR